MSALRRRGRRRGWPSIIGGLVVAVFTMLPLYWLITSSFKSAAELARQPATLVPQSVTLSNYQTAFGDYKFLQYLVNSMVVASAATVVTVALATFAGYALARMPLKGKYPIMVALLMISLFPAIAVVSPLYVLERQLGLLNSYQGLIIPHVAFNLPFAIWIMRNYMLGFSREMEESAYVDGASPTRALVSIILPQAKPAIFTVAVFTFTATWAEFLFAVTINNQDLFRTIPVGIALFGDRYSIPFGTIFAASVVAIAPISILVAIFRKSVVSGLSAGAVKE